MLDFIAKIIGYIVLWTFILCMAFFMFATCVVFFSKATGH